MEIDAHKETHTHTQRRTQRKTESHTHTPIGIGQARRANVHRSAWNWTKLGRELKLKVAFYGLKIRLQILGRLYETVGYRLKISNQFETKPTFDRLTI